MLRFFPGKIYVGFKEFREEGRIREHINDTPFFSLNNLNQTTSEKSSFLASLSTAPSLFTIIFQTCICRKVNAKVSIPCQIHKSMSVGIVIKPYKAFILIPLEYTSPLFVVASKGLCAKLESINTLIALRTPRNISESCNPFLQRITKD